MAHVVLYRFGSTCWYFYGASRDIHRDKMPNYLLQWSAMRWAKAQGCTRYDLWGAPEIFDESDRMWGVYQFKRGFRGTVRQGIGAYDFAPNALLYTAFSELAATRAERRAPPASRPQHDVRRALKYTGCKPANTNRHGSPRFGVVSPCRNRDRGELQN
ncbi:MAG: peptidoglycan bridge formation glycyltransferase FemA/FemB family protein [Chloroflexi bacterium]|nr:peptidoglycan bridge formation glycyltransferase FemA/FemB family protein [Chloroflexota bacterium]